MPLPAGLLKTVLALEELHDCAKEFTATGGKAHITFRLKGCLHERLRHIKVKNGQTLSFAIAAIIFTGAGAGVGDVVS